MKTVPTRTVQVDAPGADRFNTRPFCGQVAQSVEQRTENPRVGSSILPLATIPFIDLPVIDLPVIDLPVIDLPGG